MTDNLTTQIVYTDLQAGSGKSWLSPQVRAIFHEMYDTGDKNAALEKLKVQVPSGEYQAIHNTINSMDLKK